MKNKNKRGGILRIGYYLFLTLFLCLAFLGFFFLGFYFWDVQASILGNGFSDVVAPENCSNLSLVQTKNCLNSYVDKIYKYNETPDSMQLTFEELKRRGGDCKDWSELYLRLIRGVGFNGRTVVIPAGNDSAHMFAVISSEEGYCLLDQTSDFGCFYFEKKDERREEK